MQREYIIFLCPIYISFTQTIIKMDNNNGNDIDQTIIRLTIKVVWLSGVQKEEKGMHRHTVAAAAVQSG